MTIANKTKIEELLFNRSDIKTVDISRDSGIPYVSINQYRRGVRSYMGMNLDYAIKLTDSYDRLNSK